MEAKKAQSGPSEWFASWLGQCYKGTPNEGELNFEAAESEKEAGKDNQARQGPSAPAACSGAAGKGPGDAQQNAVATKRYLIDNSVLQIKTHPGVAFRHCKEVKKKVKGMRAAPWGDIVDGTDEGDGWLKVGSYYLPMTHEGKPVVTLAEDVVGSVSRAKGEHDEAVKPEQAVTALENPPCMAQSPNSDAADGAPEQGAAQMGIAADLKKDAVAEPDKPAALAAQDAVAEPDKPAALAAQESASSPRQGAIAEPEKQPAQHAEDSASSPEKGALLAEPEILQKAAEEEAWSAGAEVGELKKPVRSAEDMELNALVKAEVEPQRAWFLQPSVGTWLHALPHMDAEDAECAVAEDRPIHVEAPAAKWQHQPSVGTWARSRPVGIAARPTTAKAKLEDLLV